MVRPGLAELDATFDAAVGLEHHHLPRTWGTQHVATAGPTDAPALLLVHGWPQHWYAWRHVIRALAVDHRVLAVDLRGFGWSDTTAHRAERTSIQDLAGDLTAVLDHFAIDRATLAAHDWGGWIGFRAVEADPSRFRAYAALGIMAPWLSWSSLVRHLTGWAYVFPMAAAGDVVARSPRMVGWMLDHSTGRANTPWGDAEGRLARSSYAREVASAGSPRMTRHLYRSFVGAELPAALRPRTGRLDVATTVIVGEEETIARPSHWWPRTHAGEIRLRQVPSARHWLAEEAPAATIDLLRQVTGAGPAPGPGGPASATADRSG